MRRRRLGYAGAALIALVTVAACSHSGAADGTSGRSAGGGKYDAAAGASNERAPVSAASPKGAAAQPAPGALAKYPVEFGSKIRTAEMTVAVSGAGRVPAQADAAADIVTRAGGEIDSDDRTNGAQASAAMRLRVPPGELQNTLRQLARLGTEKSRQLSTTDVTEQVADVTSRVASARQAIARLRSLYDHATKVADVIAVEGELSTREADLESLEAQQRTLTRQTAMASISLTLFTAPKAAVAKSAHKKSPGGFLGGLSRGWDGFSSAAAWSAAALGTVLPFLLLLLVLGVAGRLVWTRLPHRPAPAPTPAE